MSPQPLHPEPVMQRGLVPPAATSPHLLGEGLPLHLPLPLGEGRGEGARRRGFSLVELLVVVSIMLLLMGMVAAAVSAARATQKRQATQSLIAKLDAIVQQQFASYASRSVPTAALSGANKSAARGAYLRKLASAELPDNWADVAVVVSGTAGVTLTAPQQAYTRTYATGTPSPAYADAECLFMIVMQGGIADCLDCGELGSSSKGDTDADGFFEFLDAWGQPIRYVLWPAGLELPPGSGRFFSTTAPFTSGSAAAAKGGTMRPLIFSAGSDLTNSVLVNAGGSLALGNACGDPANGTVATFGGADGAAPDGRADNITNFDAEAKK